MTNDRSFQIDLRSAARESWIYALPLIEVASMRKSGVSRGYKPNSLLHIHKLLNHRARAVTTPNNDTLYSTAHIDLTNGPVTLTMPVSGARYVSLALMDAYTNNFAILGTRTTGGGGGRFRLAGPSGVIDGPDSIRAPTAHVWLVVRVLVNGVADFDAARVIQEGFCVEGPEAPPCVVEGDRHSQWWAYFSAAAQLLAADPPPVMDRAALDRMERFGLGRNFNPTRFTGDQIVEIEAGMSDARRAVTSAGIGAGFIEGWSYPRAAIGDFGQNFFLSRSGCFVRSGRVAAR